MYNMEPTENLIADEMLKIMQKHMPENCETYLESKMLWGAIWREMQEKAKEIIPSLAISETASAQ
jgi:hypothetical protein